MKSAADAEDVFVKVLNGDFSFTDELHERKWLTVTAINLCKDRLKIWKRKAVVAIDDEPEQAAPEKEDYSGGIAGCAKAREKVLRVYENREMGAARGGLFDNRRCWI